jgi:hypothetical protein
VSPDGRFTICEELPNTIGLFSVTSDLKIFSGINAIYTLFTSPPENPSD